MQPNAPRTMQCERPSTPLPARIETSADLDRWRDEHREADAALWLAALPAPRPDWLGKLPTVAIVGEGSTEAAGETAEVVITVGVPGESVGGALWNQRRGVIAYADATAPAEAETAADVLARIRDRLIEKGVSC